MGAAIVVDAGLESTWVGCAGRIYAQFQQNTNKPVLENGRHVVSLQGTRVEIWVKLVRHISSKLFPLLIQDMMHRRVELGGVVDFWVRQVNTEYPSFNVQLLWLNLERMLGREGKKKTCQQKHLCSDSITPRFRAIHLAVKRANRTGARFHQATGFRQ